jgi:hypothetical protein
MGIFYDDIDTNNKFNSILSNFLNIFEDRLPIKYKEWLDYTRNKNILHMWKESVCISTVVKVIMQIREHFTLGSVKSWIVLQKKLESSIIVDL